ncbi:hypothetical protein [Nostoc sp. WHI]|uniref:hypothetical protein n=1 Tax=Nostoc sp. WHI TaxID=2650611 RepID=UPI0018C58959|nr:hypothetical protein [Nostoc sp. WHI]MBG1268264.1 hypothetical protein [Nostoc sp. WHI]
MTNSLTDIKPSDILDEMDGSFNRAQATGLNCLIFLALREQTTVAYQQKEWGFDDIPEQIITWCNALDDDDLLELAKQITENLLKDEFTAEEMNAKSGESFTIQGIHPEDNPSLLSDY